MKRENEKWSHYNKKKQPIKALKAKEIEDKKEPPKAVIFVENTKDSRMAGEMRKMIQEMRPWTGINVKIVERVGDKIQDILCKSNPWENMDCKRENCFTCEATMKGEKKKFKSCYQRSVVYETWCNSCKEKNERENTKESDATSDKRKRISEPEIKSIYKYIGETSRSTFERGTEHKKDLKYRREKSHLLRHCVEKHPEEDPDKVDFRMKILSSHKSAFERQIREAVLIESNAGEYSLNSKLEYSRSNIPKMKMKLGNKEEEECPFKKREQDTREKIKMLYKKETKRVKIEENKIDEKEVSDESEMKERTRKKRKIEGEKENNIDVMAQTVNSLTQTVKNIASGSGVSCGNSGENILIDMTHEKSTIKYNIDSNGDNDLKLKE